MGPTQEILDRIDKVLTDNRRIEALYLVFTGLLFAAGIACIVVALATGKFIWTIPSSFTTLFLKFPLQEIKVFRSKNIALATAPALINQLPAAEAAVEIQKLLEKLWGDS